MQILLRGSISPTTFISFSQLRRQNLSESLFLCFSELVHGFWETLYVKDNILQSVYENLLSGTINNRQP